MTNNKLNNRGFTLIELLMVILVIGILAAVGITQFVNFGTDAKDAATKANLQTLRNGIAAASGVIRIRCGAVTAATVFPAVADVTANDINTASYCHTLGTPIVITAPDNQIVATGIPINPWGAVGTNTITDATGSALGAAACGAAVTDGWCYDPTTGNIWAPTQNNPAGNENTF